MVVVERWVLYRGEGCREGARRCGEVAVVERWPLWRGGRCGEVAVSGGSTVSFIFHLKVKNYVFLLAFDLRVRTQNILLPQKKGLKLIFLTLRGKMKLFVRAT